MGKPVLRLGFTDYFDNLDEFFADWLSARYEVVRDDADPQFLIFCDETFGTQNLSYDPKKTIKIFYTGENRRFRNYAAHVGITFDHEDTPYHYRLPLYVVDRWVMERKLGMTWTPRRDNEGNCYGPEGRGFCSFISGNPGNPHRNEFFHKLNAYKKVDSYGPLFNNVGAVLPRGPEAAKNKASVLPKYKFNLCFENSEFPGYCTEKLFHALYMGTVPIYCGSTTAGLDFPDSSFLSWHTYLDDDKFLEAIVEADTNPETYEDMLWFPAERASDCSPYFSQDRFLNWFDKNVYPLKDHLCE